MKNTNTIESTDYNPTKAELKQYKSALSNVVDGLCNVLTTAKEAGAKLFQKAVDNYCSLMHINFDDLEDAAILAVLKAVKKDLRPALCTAADIGEPTFNTYASQWASELGYPKANTKTKTATKRGKADKSSDASEDMDDSETSVSEHSNVNFEITGDVETDCDHLEDVLLNLITDKAYSLTVKEVLKTVLRKAESKAVQAA
jgi:hypothetical protein